ncbi:bifunctional adenosylcobinamide kinase/adenosylcobinamide-phosphate guanylyltransferase [Cohnella sp.]|uniref:bifunctional adenosylcobinamide kinase/adenosylcobinamide-phosphate guanylyltransferase n=1 Tax=Cohnella sp. TaxID=1883426 RepID=UPI0035684EDC
MLWLVTGGVGCGKSAFAEELAFTLGREGIKLFCPPFPALNILDPLKGSELRADFTWTYSDADAFLADKLNAINLESNVFRADRRVLVVDSLSGMLRLIIQDTALDIVDGEARIDALWQEVLTSILSFQGKIIVVTEETSAGLFLNSREQWYTFKLAAVNRILSEASSSQYRLTAGVATEVKGYRVKRGERNS